MADATLSLTLSSMAGPQTLGVPHLTAELTGPDGKKRRRRLTMSGLLIGQGPDCDLVSADESVSREHCRLSLTERGVILRDLGSKNGSFVRGLGVTETLLPLDTTVILGTSQLSVTQSGPAESITLPEGTRFGKAVGATPVMRDLFRVLEQTARTDATLLLNGESGTGKGILAREVHDRSRRKQGPFVVFDCAASVPALLESELFGHAAGAFTGASRDRAGLFEEAHGGTLFLDEVGELPLEAQGRLLRVLDERHVKRVGEHLQREVDVRIIAATHRDLEAACGRGSFRSDLFFRIGEVTTVVPALRERRADLPLLVEEMLSAHRPPRALEDLPPNALELLASHPFPGNVRELRNLVTRWLIVPELPIHSAPSSSPQELDERVLGLPLREARDLVIARFERDYVRAKLATHAGEVAPAADEMGVSRQLIYRLMERYQLKRK